MPSFASTASAVAELADRTRKKKGRPKAAPYLTSCERLDGEMLTFARLLEARIAKAGEAEKHHRPGRRLRDNSCRVREGLRSGGTLEDGVARLIDGRASKPRPILSPLGKRSEQPRRSLRPIHRHPDDLFALQFDPLKVRRERRGLIVDLSADLHQEIGNGAAAVAPIGLGQKGGVDHKGTGDLCRSSDTELTPFRRGQGKINCDRAGNGRSGENKEERYLGTMGAMPLVGMTAAGCAALDA
jgi:hypothetical protein